MATYKVKAGQSIWDIALQCYGTADAVLNLILDNPGVCDFENEITAGTVLKLNGPVVNQQVVAALAGRTLATQFIEGPPVSPYHPFTDAYFAELSTPLSGAQKVRVDTLIRALVLSNQWQEISRILILVNETEEAATTCLKFPTSTRATLVNAPTFTQFGGIQGNGTTSYINTKVQASTLDLANGSMGLYTLSGNTVFKIDMGAQQNIYRSAIFTNVSGGTFLTLASDSSAYGVYATNSITSAGGFYGVTSKAGNISGYINGASAGTPSTNTGLQQPAYDIYVGCMNAEGSPLGFSDVKMGVVLLGTGNLDFAAVGAVLNAYLTNWSLNQY